jgi:uncharacterized membrane protein YdcZ (DUF606 family)
MRASRTVRCPAGVLLRIVKGLNNQLMNTPRGVLLAAACCFLCGAAGFVLAYDWTETTDRPAWLRFVAILLFLWLGVNALREGKRLWMRRSVLKRSARLGDL